MRFVLRQNGLTRLPQNTLSKRRFLGQLAVIMTPEVLEAPSAQTTSAQQSPVAQATRASLPTDAILSLDQAAALLGESLRETRNLTSVGLLKHQLIDGERCVWLSDLIAYKTDFERARARWEANPLSRMPDDSPNPVDVLPEYAHMRRR